MSRLLSFIFLVLYHAAFCQQNDLCVNATKLCAGQIYQSSNINATSSCDSEDGPCDGTGALCFGVNNTVWFSFHTNDAGGSADVTIGNINSINGDDTLQLAVVSASIPCDYSTYSVAGCLNTISSSSSSMALQALQPNTTYWIIVDGKGSSPPAGQATFDISVSGQAVQQIVNVNITQPSGCAMNDGSIQVLASSGSMYSLNGGQLQSSGTFNGLSSGVYSVSVKFSSGCDTLFNVTLVSPTITSAEAIVQPSSCNQATGSVQLTNVSGGVRPYVFSLDTVSQSDSLFTGLSAGTYEFIIHDASDPSCVFKVHVIIPTDNPVTTASTQNTLCSASQGKIISTSSLAVSPYSYALVPASGSQAGGTFSFLPAGQYTLITTAANGCRDSLPVVISEINPVTDAEVTTVPVNCSGTSFGSATVVSVEGGQQPYSYSVDGGSFQNAAVFPGIAAAAHTLTIRDANGCELEKVFAVSTTGAITCDAGEDVIKYQGAAVNLQGTATEGDILWSPTVGLSDSTITNPEVSPTKDQVYTMHVVTANGCTCEDEVKVKVAPLIVPVPNAFTPNGDGANDVWKIRNLDFYDDCVVDVYTRWGQRVFHSEGYESGDEWDGTHLGVALPAGSYYFVINLNVPVEDATNYLTGSLIIIK